MKLEKADTSNRELIERIGERCATHYTQWGKYQFNEFFDYGGEVQFARLPDIDDPIGIAFYHPPRVYENRDEKCVRINQFGIDPNHRRQRYGTEFYYALSRQWFLEGATYLWCFEHEDNQNCIDFWVSLGFKMSHQADENPNFWYLEKNLLEI